MQPPKLNQAYASENQENTQVFREVPVTYYTGRSTLSGVPALLKWQNSTITLTTVPKDTMTVPQVVFRASPMDIAWMKVRGTALILRCHDKSYTVDMTTFKERMLAGAGLSTAFGGPALELVKELVSPTGGSSMVDPWWAAQLRAAGVPLKRSKSPLIILILFALIVIGVLVAPKPH